MDFLTFKKFVSIEVLIVFYYIGAVILPAVAWYLVAWLIRKYEIVNAAYEKSKETFFNASSRKQRIKLALFFIVAFLFMELFWRMLFEFLIAYMQIRDALLQPQL